MNNSPLSPGGVFTILEVINSLHHCVLATFSRLARDVVPWPRQDRQRSMDLRPVKDQCWTAVGRLCIGDNDTGDMSTEKYVSEPLQAAPFTSHPAGCSSTLVLIG